MTWRGKIADWLTHGPRLVTEGVTRVELTDRQPVWRRDKDKDRMVWAWLIETFWENPPGSPTIREEIFNFMVPGAPITNCHTIRFVTREAALDALSAACLRWARSRGSV